MTGLTQDMLVAPAWLVPNALVMPTMKDLQVLLENKDAVYKAVADQLAKDGPELQQKDSAAYADLLADWTALSARYQAARTAAQAALAKQYASLFPDALSTFKPEYDAVIRASQLLSGRVTKGDLADIYGRIAAIEGKNFPTPVPHAISQDSGASFLAGTTAVAPWVEDHILPGINAMATLMEHPLGSVTAWWSGKTFVEKAGIITLGALGIGVTAAVVKKL